MVGADIRSGFLPGQPDMVGTCYSKRPSFPRRETDPISDAMDERGLHSDRLSTFSFSSSTPPTTSTKNKIVAPVVSAAAVVVAALSMGADGNVDDTSTPDGQKKDSLLFGNTNEYTLVEARKSSTSAVTCSDLSSTAATVGGQDNHADRLSTFSLSNMKLDSPSSSGGTMSSSGGGNGGLSSSKTVNHDDRLGTFSFASTDPQSGSTSVWGTTSASSPLPSTSESKIIPPQTKAAAEDSRGSTSTTVRSNNDESRITTNSGDRPTPQQQQTGSLSYIASSVSIKSRNDRIKDIKEATDPKLLHPDGMNIPRLNSKGDVLTLSNTGGRKNIFERINQVTVAAAQQQQQV